MEDASVDDSVVMSSRFASGRRCTDGARSYDAICLLIDHGANANDIAGRLSHTKVKDSLRVMVG